MEDETKNKKVLRFKMGKINYWIDWNDIVKDFKMKKLLEDLAYRYIIKEEFDNKLKELRNER